MIRLYAAYPGPKGLGLIEAISGPLRTSTKQLGILGRKAWASLKPLIIEHAEGCITGILGRKAWASLKRCQIVGQLSDSDLYPGPKGLGLIEADPTSEDHCPHWGVSWAERPGPH